MTNSIANCASGYKELDKSELMEINGGELTAKQEVWLERCIAYCIFGLAGVAIYELGRING